MTTAAALLSFVGLIIEIGGIAWVITAAVLASRRLLADIKLIEWTTYEVVRRNKEGEDGAKTTAWRNAELAKHGIVPDTMYGHEGYTLRRVLAAIAAGEAGSFLAGGVLIVTGLILQGVAAAIQLGTSM